MDKYSLIFSCFTTIPFTSSELELDYYHQKVNVRGAEQFKN